MTSDTTHVIDSPPPLLKPERKHPRRNLPTTAVLILAVAAGAALIASGMIFAASGISDMASTTTVPSTTVTTNATDAGVAARGTDIDTGVGSVWVEGIVFAIPVETVTSVVAALTGV